MGMDQEDKMNLINNAGSKGIAGGNNNTRNLQKNRFIGANTNGATESPSMEI
jgi:hypothetical protein